MGFAGGGTRCAGGAEVARFAAAPRPLAWRRSALAKDIGLDVMATTRDNPKSTTLVANGADEVLIDIGQLAQAAHELLPEGFDCTLDLVGTVTLRDSLQAMRRRGIVCMTGILGSGGRWTRSSRWRYPGTVRLTVYDSQMITAANGAGALQRIVDGVEAGRYHTNLHKVFPLDQIVDAHRYMEENRGTGKLVVVTE